MHSDVGDDDPPAPVARRTPQRVAGRDVADREHVGVAQNPQVLVDADESLGVENVGRQKPAVWAHPADRPEHEVGLERRLPGRPLERSPRQAVANETFGERGAVTRVDEHAITM